MSGGDYVDAVMRGVQGTPEKTPVVRFRPLSLRLGVAGTSRVKQADRVCGNIVKAGMAVAKIIEFYIPSDFRKTGKWIPPSQRGKLIEFVPATRRSA